MTTWRSPHVTGWIWAADIRRGRRLSAGYVSFLLRAVSRGCNVGPGVADRRPTSTVHLHVLSKAAVCLRRPSDIVFVHVTEGNQRKKQGYSELSGTLDGRSVKMWMHPLKSAVRHGIDPPVCPQSSHHPKCKQINTSDPWKHRKSKQTTADMWLEHSAWFKSTCITGKHIPTFPDTGPWCVSSPQGFYLTTSCEEFPLISPQCLPHINISQFGSGVSIQFVPFLIEFCMYLISVRPLSMQNRWFYIMLPPCVPAGLDPVWHTLTVFTKTKTCITSWRCSVFLLTALLILKDFQ